MGRRTGDGTNLIIMLIKVDIIDDNLNIDGYLTIIPNKFDRNGCLNCMNLWSIHFISVIVGKN